uniref:Gamma-aminobutyric acid type A receptor subunit epsilon n=1 Tax=Molossus molossus TaxID=27622 RepID=A0A7J8J6F0_MOLMO|nr:gamma-aminobutyric acid type A receptor subunit epsilon [Molossus molossus]
MSWISFWIKKDSAPARTSLGEWVSLISIHARVLTPPHAHAYQQQQDAFVCEFEDSKEESDEEEGPYYPTQQSLHSSLTQCCGSCCRFCKYLCVVRSCEGSMWQQGCIFIHIYCLDNYSRVFPVTFFSFNVLYWLVCLNL